MHSLTTVTVDTTCRVAQRKACSLRLLFSALLLWLPVQQLVSRAIIVLVRCLSDATAFLTRLLRLPICWAVMQSPTST